jgi:hypothetical protein
MGQISPGIAFGVIYIILGMKILSISVSTYLLAVPVVLMLDIPLSFETDTDEAQEKKLMINTEVQDQVPEFSS